MESRGHETVLSLGSGYSTKSHVHARLYSPTLLRSTLEIVQLSALPHSLTGAYLLTLGGGSSRYRRTGGNFRHHM